MQCLRVAGIYRSDNQAVTWTLVRRRSGRAVGFCGASRFRACAIYLGGDAINGIATSGHYFLADHGHLTEVSRTVFTNSQWHAHSVFVTFPIAFFCTLALKRKPSVSN
jgi:hypothetical protein